MSSDFRLGPDGIYRCEGLNGFVFANHGFGTRLANPPVDVTLRQIHSDLIWNARGLDDRAQEGDALISTEAGLTIGVRTADCVPILLIDPETRAIAAIHAGWRGTAGRILEKTVSKLTQGFGTRPDQVRAAIGPCIRDCCYEVGPEVAGEFVSQFPEWHGTVTRLNLPEANRRQLLAAGVPAAQIFDSGLCTACSIDHLFSYRREPANPGRMVASVGLVL